MFAGKRTLVPLADRGPLRVLFTITSMPVGGAETLLVNLIRRMDRERFAPEICCLKEPGPLGEQMAGEVPVHARLTAGKFDVLVLRRLTQLMRGRKIDAVVTVGAGDKMFWGRLAAWRAQVPVVISAIHSTGWPDGISRLNRLLTSITDAFVGVAKPHGEHLVHNEKFPPDKVYVIPNGVDVARFRRDVEVGRRLRQECGIPADAPVCGIVAALRPEKNHSLFLRAAAIVHRDLPAAHYVIVGDGPERTKLEETVRETGLGEHVHFLGTRGDVPQVLSMLDLFALTSHNEANPVSILEAMSTGMPVVSTDVGSVAETVHHGATGYLAKPGAAVEIAGHWRELLSDPARANQMGQAARQIVVDHWSLDRMVQGYQRLITEIYDRKCPLTLTFNAIVSGTTMKVDEPLLLNDLVKEADL